VSVAHLYSGKVREIFDAGDGLLLIVTSDRISAFDSVFAEPVPDKGRVLMAMTAFWAGELEGLSPTHLVSADTADFEEVGRRVPGFSLEELAGRAMLVRRAEMLPVECIVRGYLTGSAWKQYRADGTMHGIALRTGLRESERLDEPVFTPSTKATEGHDVNISLDEAADMVGAATVTRAQAICVAAYEHGASLALGRGIIIADTKFELGFIDGELAICDEILTPDSSRFWAADAWSPGTTPPSFDKQPVRDWALSTGWDTQSAPPPVPAEVLGATRARYVAAYEQITGLSFTDWHGART